MLALAFLTVPLKAEQSWIPTDRLKEVAASGEKMRAAAQGWQTLFDGSDLGSWNRLGNANWKLATFTVRNQGK